MKRRGLGLLGPLVALLLVSGPAAGGDVPVPAYVRESAWRENDSRIGGILAIRELADGTVIVVGSSTLCLLGPDGSLLSAMPFDPPIDPLLFAAVDPHGAVFVAGGYGAAAAVAKLDGRTGRRLWAAASRYVFPAVTASVSDLRLDPAGNPVLAVRVSYYPSRYASDLAVVSFSGGSGELRLAGRVDLATQEYPAALAIAPSGELIVAALTEEPARPTAAAIVSFSGSDGRVLWTARPGGAGAAIDRVMGLGLDGEGAWLFCTGPDSQGGNEARFSRLRLRDGAESLVRRLGAAGFAGNRGWLGVADGSLAFAVLEARGSDDAYEVFRLDLATGDVVRGPVAFTGRPTAPASIGNRVCVQAYGEAGVVLRCHGEDTRAVWEAGLPGTNAQQTLALRSGDLLTVSDRLEYVRRSWLTATYAVRSEGATGQPSWTRRLDGPARDPLEDQLAVSGFGTLYVSGTAVGTVVGGGALWSLAFDEDSGEKRWGPVALETDEVNWRQVALDEAGNLLRAVSSARLGSIEVDSLDGRTGVRRWGPVTVTAGLRDVRLVEMAVDAVGGLHVLGESDGGAVLLTLESGSGALRRRLSFPAVTPASIAATPAGEVAIAAVDRLRRGWLLRLSASSPDAIWGPLLLDLTYPLKAAGSRVTVDARGDVLAFWSTETGTPFLTRLDGGSGASSWEPLAVPSRFRTPSLTREEQGLLVMAVSEGGGYGTDPAPLDVWTLGVDTETGRIAWGPARHRGLEEPKWARETLQALALDGGGHVEVLTRTDPEPFDPRPSVFRSAALTGEPLDPASPPWEADLVVGLADGFALVEDAQVVRYHYGLGFDVTTLAPAACGRRYEQQLEPRNGVPPYALAIANGSLPLGLSLDQDHAAIAGTPAGAPAPFTFTVEVSDSRGAVARRELRLDVGPADDLSISGPSLICAGSSATLEAPAGFASYSWTPGGEASRVLTVTPAHSTSYAVTAVEPGGCVHRGSLEVRVLSDARPPEVMPPPPTTVVSSTCRAGQAGATPSTSPALAAYLAGGSARDDCDLAPGRLAPMASGVEVTPQTLFPAGSIPVTFRFRDASGAVGASTAFLVVLRLGDLDGSGDVSVTDLVILAAHIAGNIPAGTVPFTAPAPVADANADGSIDVFDLVLLAAHLVGNVACLPERS